MASAVALERQKLLSELETLLQAPGELRSWDEVREDLATLKVEALRSLVYRVRSARTDAYEDGVAHGRGVEQ
jgi:hypothetical protein